MRKYFFILVIIMAVLGAVFFVHSGYGEQEIEDSGEQVDIFQESQFDIETHIIREDDTFTTVLEDLGIGYSKMLEILDATSSTYDFTKVRVGQPFNLAKDYTGNIVYFEYETNRDYIVRVDFGQDGYHVEKMDIPYDIEIITQSAVVSSSLYVDGLAVDVPEEIIMQFADTFAWTIDFALQVRRGDIFEVVYEKRFREGQDAGTGRMLAGKFVNDGTEYDAYLFEDEEGDPTYFNGEGESMYKQFLRVPLNYRQITSRYTYARFDPISHINTPHLAIDYAAAIGTPIMAVGDGVVRFAGRNNQGYGNFISIRHNEVYTTEYAHLSAFAKGIKVGATVKQGQVIGYVGTTGHSTGPHLHYQIKYYGKLVNPLEIELPPGEPVAEAKRGEFERVKAEFEKMF